MKRVSPRTERALTALFLSALLLSGCQQEGTKETPPSSSSYPTLGATPFPPDYPLPSLDRLDISKRVHQVIAKNDAHPKKERDMRPYDLVADRVADASMRMLVIPSGEFVMGSTRESEGPPKRVRVEAFWMCQIETNWHFYRPYLHNGKQRRSDGRLIEVKEDTPLVDLISAPTETYRDHFNSGELPSKGLYPAMNMTHHAASKWCQWLSAQTGHFYRLPTEAEWEYACRAGTSTDYAFGDDPAKIGDHGWFADNSDFQYHPPGRKAPNKWGLVDMHGNVAEWVLDGFDPNFRSSLEDGVINPWRIPETRYFRIFKGGGWDHEADDLRCAARDYSNKNLKEWDPAVPKSIWAHTHAQHIGFRIIRPLKTPSAEEMHLYWNTDWWNSDRNSEDL